MQYTHFVLRHSNFRGPRSDFKYCRKHVRKKQREVSQIPTSTIEKLSLPPTLDTSVWSLYTMSLCSWNPTITLVHRAAVHWLQDRGTVPFSHLLWHSLLWCGLRNLQQGRRKSYHLKTSSSKRTLIWSNLFLFIKPFLSLGHLNFQHIVLGTHAGSSSANGKPLFPAEASIVTRTPKERGLTYHIFLHILTYW